MTGFWPDLKDATNIGLVFLTHVEEVFDSVTIKKECLLPPFAHQHDFYLSPSLPSIFYRSFLTSGQSGCEWFLPLSSPRGNVLIPPPHPLAPTPPHHLIIIHLGGRISTAWDIRPITQSRRATSPGLTGFPPHSPFALTPRSNFLERTLCLTQVCEGASGCIDLPSRLTSLNCVENISESDIKPSLARN